MTTVLVPLVTMLLIHVVVSAAFLTLPVVAPAAAPDVGIDPALVGFYTSLAYSGAMVSSLMTGALIVRLGAIRTAQIGLALAALGLAIATGGTPGFMVLSALVVGVGHGPMTPVGAHVLMGRTPPGVLALVFSIKQTGVPLGLFMVGAVVPTLVVMFGWRIGVLAVAGTCALAAYALQPLRAAIDADRAPGNPISFGSIIAPIRLVFGSQRLRQLTLVSSVFGIAQFCFSSFFVVYLTGGLGVDLISAGLYFSSAQMAGLVARLAWGVLTDRTGAPRIVLGGLGVAIAGAALATASLTPAWPGVAILAVALLFGFTAIGWNGVLLAEVARQAPEGKAGAATAGLLFMFGATMLVGPSGFSMVVTVSGSYGLGYALVALLVVLSALPMFLSVKDDREA